MTRTEGETMIDDRPRQFMRWLHHRIWDMTAILGTALIVGGAYLLIVGALNSQYWTWNWMTYMVGGCVVVAIAYAGGLWEARKKAVRD